MENSLISIFSGLCCQNFVNYYRLNCYDIAICNKILCCVPGDFYQPHSTYYSLLCSMIPVEFIPLSFLLSCLVPPNLRVTGLEHVDAAPTSSSCSGHCSVLFPSPSQAGVPVLQVPQSLWMLTVCHCPLVWRYILVSIQGHLSRSDHLGLWETKRSL